MISNNQRVLLALLKMPASFAVKHNRKFYLNKIINHQDLGTVIVSIKGRSRIEKV